MEKLDLGNVLGMDGGMDISIQKFIYLDIYLDCNRYTQTYIKQIYNAPFHLDQGAKIKFINKIKEWLIKGK